MAPAKKDSEKQPSLKGKEAEDRILQYMRESNRPYGAADVSANIKNAVTKPATQKILITLAEKGAITRKDYGKTTYFVAKQADCEDMSTIQLDALEAQAGIIADEIKDLSSQQKHLNSELASIRAAPPDDELEAGIRRMELEIKELETILRPLREGSALVSEEEVKTLDQDWSRWRSEWLDRRKTYLTAWGTLADALGNTDLPELADEIGIELDSEEHAALERSSLCQPPSKRR